MRHSLFLQLHRMASERWIDRMLRRVLRCSWLALCAWCAGIGLSLVLGQAPDLALTGTLSLLILLAGLVMLLFERRMSAHMVARRLDRRFRLQEQLATALEIASTRPEHESIAAHLLDQSANTLRHVRRRLNQKRQVPWSDLVTLLAVLLVAIGLFLIAGIGHPMLAAEPQPLPTLLGSAGDPLADEPLDPTNRTQISSGAGDTSAAPGADPTENGAGLPGQGTDEQQAGNGQDANQQANGGQPGTQGQQNTSSQGQPQVSDPTAQRNIDEIANALRDQGVTRPAADALDRGDLRSASQELRALADQASALSDSTRRDLANDLRRAASQIQQNNPALAQQLRDSARGIERGNDQAALGLDQLAQAIESMAGQQPGESQQGQGQGEGQGSGQEALDGQQPGQGQQIPGQGGQGEGNQTGSGGGAGNMGAGEQRPIDNSSRIGADGQPLPIEVQGPGSTSGPPPDQATAGGIIAVGGVAGGNASSSAGGSGPDPLRVPLDERDVVQDYFTPTGPN